MTTDSPADGMRPTNTPHAAHNANHRAAEERLDGRIKALIAVLTAANFIMLLNETTMANAIADLEKYFHITDDLGQWLTSAFLLTMSVVIPLSGWIIDRCGPRGTLLIALSVFILGTALAATAPTFGILLVSRVIQALGTGLMTPLLMSTLMRVVPENRRGGVMGYVSLAIAVAPALGPLLSGVMLEFFGWRLIFGLTLSLAIIVAVIGVRLIEHIPGSVSGLPDLPSVLLSAIGFGVLVWGLSAIDKGGDFPVPAAILIAAGLLGIAAMVVRQLSRKRSGKQPLLDVTVFRHSYYGLGIALMTFCFSSFLGITVILPLVLQNARGVSALTSGIIIMSSGLATGLLGPVVGRWYDRMGARPLVIFGAFLVFIAVGIIAWIFGSAPWQVIAVVSLFFGAGLALLFTPIFTFSLSMVHPDLYSHGSAILATMQQVGGAVGIATLVSVMGIGARSVGTDAAPNLAIGGQWALTMAAGLMAVVLVLSFFIPRAADLPSNAAAH